eukprot:6230958-Pyramimonas_sp.AAC.1
MIPSYASLPAQVDKAALETQIAHKNDRDNADAERNMYESPCELGAKNCHMRCNHDSHIISRSYVVTVPNFMFTGRRIFAGCTISCRSSWTRS